MYFLSWILNTTFKVNPKWIKYLNVRLGTVRLLQENRRKALQWSWQWFSGYDTKSRSSESKVDKWDFIKLKSCYTAEQTVNKVKWEPVEWEKILLNHVFGKEIYKEHIEFISKKET